MVVCAGAGVSGPEIAWGCDGLLGMLQQPEHFRVKGHGQDLDLGQGGQPALGGRVKSSVVCLGVGVGGCSVHLFNSRCGGGLECCGGIAVYRGFSARSTPVCM